MSLLSPPVPLARSALVRFVGLVAAVFLAGFLATAAFVWQTAGRFIEQRVGETIRTDISGLEAVWQEGGIDALKRVLERRAANPLEVARDRIVLIVGADGEPVAGNFATFPNDSARQGDLITFRTPVGSRPYSGIIREIPGGPTLIVAHGRAEYEALAFALARDLALPGLGALLVALVATVLGGRLLMRRIDRISAAAAAVEAGDLAARAPGADASDEFGRLARQVNAMLERIAALVRGVHSLSDQIAHETRTPLARLRSRLERARRRAEDMPAAQPLVDAFDAAIADSDALIGIFGALLDIAHTEAAAGDASGLASVDLAQVIADVVDLYEAVAEDRGVALAVTTAPATVLGERTLLMRMVANVVDNAIKFSPAGGTIDITLTLQGTDVTLAVRDRGPGIPGGFEATAFDRFTRGDGTAGVPGHGLGLSLVRAVALRHGMRIELVRAEPGLEVRTHAHAAEG